LACASGTPATGRPIVSARAIPGASAALAVVATASVIRTAPASARIPASDAVHQEMPADVCTWIYAIVDLARTSACTLHQEMPADVCTWIYAIVDFPIFASVAPAEAERVYPVRNSVGSVSVQVESSQNPDRILASEPASSGVVEPCSHEIQAGTVGHYPELPNELKRIRQGFG
jgi:hypothetical protein